MHTAHTCKRIDCLDWVATETGAGALAYGQYEVKAFRHDHDAICALPMHCAAFGWRWHENMAAINFCWHC